MADAVDETNEPLRVAFDRRLKLEFHGTNRAAGRERLGPATLPARPKRPDLPRQDTGDLLHLAAAHMPRDRAEHAANGMLSIGRARAMQAGDDNAAFTRDVGHPLTSAIQAFGKGDYRETVRLLRPIRAIAHRFGGSHAQRDVIDLTLIEAALRAGDTALSRALAAERYDARPASPLSRLFLQRAGVEGEVA